MSDPIEVAKSFITGFKKGLNQSTPPRVVKQSPDSPASIERRRQIEELKQKLGDKDRQPTPAASSSGLLDRVKREISEIEFRTDLTTDEKIRQVIHITCATCAGVAIQPIPFADIFILTPIQIYMGTRIAAIRGVPISEAEADEILKEIIGALGMGFVAQQTALGIWKFIIPGAGGFMTIPIVYGLSYAIMNVMDAYFVAKASNRRLSATEIKALWGKARAEGESQALAQEQDAKK
jgi:uncharacterized protein (DUF697 family)